MHPLQFQLYQFLKTIPTGKVCSYRQAAEYLGNKNLARAVGKWLNANADLETIPCYKVVCSDGSVGGYAIGLSAKMARLKNDGVLVVDGKISQEYFIDSFFLNLVTIPNEVEKIQ